MRNVPWPAPPDMPRLMQGTLHRFGRYLKFAVRRARDGKRTSALAIGRADSGNHLVVALLWSLTPARADNRTAPDIRCREYVITTNQAAA